MNRLKRFFRTRWVEILITGVWLQSVISALFTGIWWLILLAVFGGLALVLLILWGVDRLTETKGPAYGNGEAFEVPRRAILFTVGMQDQTLRFALDRQQPQWLGLICTRRSAAIAQQVTDDSGLDEEHVQTEIVDPWSVVEVREKVRFILDWCVRHGVPSPETAVDITGGTSIMTAATFSVACERQIDCQYVRSEYDQNNRVVADTQRGVFVTRYSPTPAPDPGPRAGL